MIQEELDKQMEEFLANGGKIQTNYVKPMPISDKWKFDNGEFSSWYFCQRKKDKDLAKLLGVTIGCMRNYAYGRRKMSGDFMLKFKKLISGG